MRTREPYTIDTILNRVGSVLLDKGDDYSVGQLVATYTGDGSSPETDPYNVYDRHFYRDIEQVNEWPDESRDPAEVTELIDAFEAVWKESPGLRFCQIVCNAHIRANGMGDWDPDGSPYAEPLDALTDDQLLDYLEDRLADEDE